jgi:hypothetical protein
MKKFASPFIICSLFFIICVFSCDLFTGPKVDVLQKISDEKRWADAPQLTVRIEFPSIWGASEPAQGNITPVMDIRLDFEFSVKFTPDSVYSLHTWMAYFTKDLEGLSDSGSWTENLDLLDEISTLDEKDITFPENDPSGGTFKFTIHTAEPVTLIPWCDTKPRITRTEPLDIKSSSQPVSRASDITLYFNGALNRDSVVSAYTEDAPGIWITSTDDDDFVTYNKDERWYSDPEYAAVGGFFTVTMYCMTLPPPDSLINVTVKGIRNAQGELMDEAGYSFSWNTSSAQGIDFDSWSAKYIHNPNDNSGKIEVAYKQTGADDLKLYYRLNRSFGKDIANNTIIGVTGPDYSGIRNGGQATGINEYEINIELYKDGMMENKVSIKIWNIPGMSVEYNRAQDIETRIIPIRTAEELAAIKDNLDGQYALANNITVTGEWTPIGTEITPFTGKLYGNGHIITFNSNSSINSETNYIGLFGYAQNAVIRDFTFDYNSPVKNINVYSEYFIGGVAGYLKDTDVSNVITSGGTLSINVADYGYGNIRLGGITGYIEGSGIIENCRAALSVKYTSDEHSGNISIGAAAGETGEGNASRKIPIKNGYNRGVKAEGPNVTLNRLLINGVTVNTDVSAVKKLSNIFIGGAVGKSRESTMNDIAFTDGLISFSGSSIYCGGITGVLEKSNLTESYFAGNIMRISDNNDPVNGQIYLGGLIGYIYINDEGYYFINKCRVQTKINLKGFSVIKAGGIYGEAFTFYTKYVEDAWYIDEEGKPFLVEGAEGTEGSLTITNCFFNGGEINVEKSNEIYLGGFSSWSSGGAVNINNCGALSGTITVDAISGNRIGGFISHFEPNRLSRPYNVSNSFSMIDIITKGACQHVVGGFISSIYFDNISNCYATGTVYAIINGDNGENYGSYIGGFAGSSYGIIQNCYALGNVLVDYSGEKNEVGAGGFIGSINYEASVSNCFSAGRVSVGSKQYYVNSGGIAGSNGGVIYNTAALCASVTVGGPDKLPNPNYIPGGDSSEFFPSRGLGRIWGGGSGNNDNNYALNTMIIENDEYGKTNPGTRSAVSNKNGPDGQDATSSTFLTRAFWETTLNFSPNIWDFSRVARDGHPRLINVGGQ